MKSCYQDQIEFFNSHAEKWDSYATSGDLLKIDAIIKKININPLDKILDVALVIKGLFIHLNSFIHLLYKFLFHLF
jgi:hypothetical protein